MSSRCVHRRHRAPAPLACSPAAHLVLIAACSETALQNTLHLLSPNCTIWHSFRVDQPFCSKSIGRRTPPFIGSPRHSEAAPSAMHSRNHPHWLTSSLTVSATGRRSRGVLVATGVVAGGCVPHARRIAQARRLCAFACFASSNCMAGNSGATWPVCTTHLKSLQFFRSALHSF
eukprot:6189704-Pleurochrysis_carterae.AAC.4